MYFTEKQLRIMEFIQQFRAERGISPTLEEIAENFGVTKITIYEHINQLERKGALKREKFRARSIELLVPVEERGNRYSLPVMGRLRAGSPIEATEERENVNLAELVPLGKNTFVLQVRGTTLVDDHVTDGDFVIVQKRDQIRDGDTVVAVVDGGVATMKKYFLEGDRRVRLQSLNGSMESMYPRSADVRGVVVGIYRNLTVGGAVS